MWVDQKQKEALIDPKNRGNILNESLINACAVSLKSQRDEVRAREIAAGHLKNSVNEQCRVNNYFTNVNDRHQMCRLNSLCAWINGSCQVNDPMRQGPSQSLGKWVEFSPYTSSAMSILSTLKLKDGAKSTYKDFVENVEKLLVNKLFTEYFIDKVQPYTKLRKLVDTSGVSGVMANKYIAHFNGEQIKYFCKFLINKYKLKVTDNEQDSLLKEVLEAYINNETYLNKAFVNEANEVPDVNKVDKWMQEFMDVSPEANHLFKTHDLWVAQYIH
jgi:hypothetical protein